MIPDRELISRVCAFVDGQNAGDEPCSTSIEGLWALRSRRPTSRNAVLYNPLLCLILQGSKETNVGSDRVCATNAGESIIVSHDLPVESRVIEASTQLPYVALILRLDLSVLRSLYDEVGVAAIDSNRAKTFDVDKTETMLGEAMGRLFELVDRPVEAKVMVPLVVREIHFRLLLARHGGMLRELLRLDSHASRITKAILQIKKNYDKSLAIKELADVVGMSLSSFHEHFKLIMGTTPLQYQKELRLLKARQLLMDGEHSVSRTAFMVGYESPTQFSREYSRKFGSSPKKDMPSYVSK